MQWYVYVITISAPLVLSWVALELLGRPIRALVGIRRNVREQMLVVGNLSLPRPREMAVSSRDIREHDQAMRNMREAQRILHDLGCRLLAFGENERAICIAMELFGLNIISAGRGLINLSEAYLRPEIDRAGLRNEVQRALRITGAAAPASRRPQLDSLTEFQTESMDLRGTVSST